MEQKSHIPPRFRRFARQQDGAVTVDWVVLTATIIGLGMAAAFFVGANVPGLANKTSSYMTSVDVTP